jgi:hypothetical protein
VRVISFFLNLVCGVRRRGSTRVAREDTERGCARNNNRIRFVINGNQSFQERESDGGTRKEERRGSW